MFHNVVEVMPLALGLTVLLSASMTTICTLSPLATGRTWGSAMKEIGWLLPGSHIHFCYMFAILIVPTVLGVIVGSTR
jgi:hypothetical protein